VILLVFAQVVVFKKSPYTCSREAGCPDHIRVSVSYLGKNLKNPKYLSPLVVACIYPG